MLLQRVGLRHDGVGVREIGPVRSVLFEASACGAQGRRGDFIAHTFVNTVRTFARTSTTAGHLGEVIAQNAVATTLDVLHTGGECARGQVASECCLRSEVS